MQYTKTMIDLIFQIRKIAPAPVRPRVKLTNPNLFDTLVDFYHLVDDDKLRVLIYELLSHAGPEWLTAIASANPESNSAPTASPNIPTLTNSEPSPTPPPEKKATKTVIYRGRKMEVPA